MARGADQAAARPDRLVGRLERQRQHVAHVTHEVEGHRLADGLGHVVEVGTVALGQDHLAQPGPVRGEHLLLHPADRQHAALQGDLTGHAHARAHGPAGQQADQRGRHGDAGRGPVLGHRARGHVQVEAAGEGVAPQPEVVGVRAHEGQRDLGRLLHDVAQLAGDAETGLTVHRDGLDEEDVAARAGHGEARGHTGNARAVGRLEEEARAPEIGVHVGPVDGDRRFGLARRDPRRDLAQQPPELTLEVSHSGLACSRRRSRAARRRARPPRPGRGPLRSSWRASRCWRAMATFSSSV